MTISNLTYSDTFKTWFDRTNTVINTVNGITVYNILPGDGITVSSSAGIFTVSHSNNVNTGVTFGGNIIFNGSVQFNGGSPSISTSTIAVSPKITGITAGNFVRIDTTGLTLAKANSNVNAEVLGVVLGETSTATTVGIGGSINTGFFNNIFVNALGYAGATLKSGQAYFLDPVVAGGITTIEPTTYGQVSKPVVLGITGDSGLFLPYRGVIIEGISAGITAELDNKIIIQISSYSPLDETQFTVNVGDPVFYVDDSALAISAVSSTVEGGSRNAKLRGALNDSTITNCFIGYPNSSNPNTDNLLGKEFLGLISKIISTDDTNDIIILEVTLPGGSFNVNTNELDANFYTQINRTSPLEVSSDGVLKRVSYTGDSPSTSKFCDFIFTDLGANLAKIVLSGKQSSVTSSTTARILPSGLVTTGITGALEYDNLIPNGAFTVWQRGVTSLTAGSLETYTTPFADRWFVIQNNTTGLTANVSRQEFVSNQTEVTGSPLYYVDAQFQHSAISLEVRPRLENIQREARLLQNQQITLSFWAKSTTSGSTLDIVYNRYKDSYNSSIDVEYDLESRILVTTGLTLGTSWTEHAYTFTPAVAGFTLAPTEKGWFSVGFEFPSSSSTISIAQVQLETGDSVSKPIYVSPEQEIERCKPYYFRTYDEDQNNGFTGSSRLNEHVLSLGNLITQRAYSIKYPIELVQDPAANKVYIYSPSGQINDAFNVNTGKDMRYSGTGTVSLPWDTNTVRSSSAWPNPNISIGAVNRYGMVVNIIDGATHLDTLKFHYVVDADIDLNI